MEELCCWGCGQPSTLPKSKYGKGPRCSERCYDCPGYKKNKSMVVPWNKGKTGVQTPWSKGRPGTFKGKTHSELTKSKISEKLKGNQNSINRGDRQSFYKGIRMDSRWEVGTATYLDYCGICWKYNERGYRLSDGRFYYPDFFIYENNTFHKLIEVKGYFREANKKKFEMFQTEYPDVKIELWTKIELKERGIINASGKVINGSLDS